MTDAHEAGEDILFERRGRLGLVTLNRPKALNALTGPMARALKRRLDAWADDAAVEVVAIVGSGERAFCAGGDIRALYEAGRPGGERGSANDAFYADEYRLNRTIKRFPKPYVAIMDGITMGGGVGMSIHGSVRIATERTVFAMPETGIGFFPDVGATWFLPRLSGATGMWLGLTGARLKGEEAVLAGVCDFHLPSHRIDWQLDWLAEGRWEHPPEGREIELLTPAPGPQHELRQHGLRQQEAIDRVFSARSLDAILDRLEGRDDDWAKETRETLAQKSPPSLAVAFRQLAGGAAMDFEDAMRLEYDLARFFMRHPDFYEGVRAAVVEKDRPPDWSPPTLDAGDGATIERAFAGFDDKLDFS
ncbi:MAG: enoyl-CoA hydratase/isomerase family protein [Paracoccaceae bacterium]